MSLGLYAQAPLTITGAQTAFMVLDPQGSLPAIEFPMFKATIRKMSQKTEATGSTDVALGEVWQTWGKAPSGWTLTVEGTWRITGGGAFPGTGAPAVTGGRTPPNFKQGGIYYVGAFVRRPGWRNTLNPDFPGGVTTPADVGSAYLGYIFVDDNQVDLDTRSGIVSWRLSATGQGVLIDPVNP